MADWEDLRRYIKSKYKVAEDALDTVKLLFELDDGRSQAVLVRKAGNLEGSDWAEISTAVCNEDDIDARDALIRSSGMLVGGLALLDGGPVIFRHSFPLADLDPGEFDRPLKVAVFFGDQLERELTKQDRY